MYLYINKCNTSKKCCHCNKDKEGKKVFSLLVCSNCVSCENKKNRIYNMRFEFLYKHNEINELLDRKTRTTIMFFHKLLKFRLLLLQE